MLCHAGAECHCNDRWHGDLVRSGFSAGQFSVGLLQHIGNTGVGCFCEWDGRRDFIPRASECTNITENTISTCGGLEGNAACAPIGSNCIAGVNETRVVNGLPITKSCWKMEYTYSCKSGVGPDYCAPLVAEPKCAQIGVSGCSVYGPDGTCSTYNADYKCTTDMGPPPNVSQTGVGYDILKDNLDTKLCDPYTANPNCTKIGSVCVDDQDRHSLDSLSVAPAGSMRTRSPAPHQDQVIASH